MVMNWAKNLEKVYGRIQYIPMLKIILEKYEHISTIKNASCSSSMYNTYNTIMKWCSSLSWCIIITHYCYNLWWYFWIIYLQTFKVENILCTTSLQHKKSIHFMLYVYCSTKYNNNVHCLVCMRNTWVLGLYQVVEHLVWLQHNPLTVSIAHFLDPLILSLRSNLPSQQWQDAHSWQYFLFMLCGTVTSKLDENASVRMVWHHSWWISGVWTLAVLEIQHTS